jgi:hypothetical protein
VYFSSPSCTGHLSIDYYQAVCTATGSHSATGSSPISITGLSSSTSYTFKVRAHNSKGYGCYSSSTGTATTQAVRGSSSYTTTGCYTFTAPCGVNSVSLFAVGGGSTGRGLGGGAGASGYRNNWPTNSTSGRTLSIRVGYSCVSAPCQAPNPYNQASWVTTYNGYYVMCVGYGPNGGATQGRGYGFYPGRGYCMAANRCGSRYHRNVGGYPAGAAGGGAAGYGALPSSSACDGSVLGGNSCASGGGGYGIAATASQTLSGGRTGTGGGASGGGSAVVGFPYCPYTSSPPYQYYITHQNWGAGGGGGGVGLCGQGSNGALGSYSASSYYCMYGTGGTGGSGGTTGGCGHIIFGCGTNGGYGGAGGSYGGGAGGSGFYINYVGAYCYCCGYPYWAYQSTVSAGVPIVVRAGGSGAVVVLYPGCSRSYPSTSTSR